MFGVRVRVSFWLTVWQNGSPYAISDRCLSCLSVTLVYCDQTVGWIRMPFGLVVGLGPGHSVLDGDPAPRAEMGTAAPPLFSPYLLVPNGRVAHLRYCWALVR